MTTSPLDDAFAHHVWATLRVLDACSELDAEQLQTEVVGTYGPIIDTLRHIVGADAAYLSLLSEGRVPNIDESAMTIAELRAVMERHGPVWRSFLASSPDPEVTVVRYRDDGSESHAPMGIRIAQVVHHGSDHRSQVCTALTTLGIEPPAIDVWDFGETEGRLAEIPPTT